MISSRDINDLLPVVQPYAKAFVVACAAVGIDVLIISTYRDVAAQDALYNQGRTTPGPIVTNAKGGQSFHNYRCAFDFVPIVNGKANWMNTSLFTQCGQIGVSLGLEWAGNWKSFRESGHCQYTGGLSLQDLQAGKVPV